jgi:hypothetical protein
MIPLVVIPLLYSLAVVNRELGMVSMGLFAIAIILTILEWIFCARTRCPLCLTPVLAAKSCSKHRKARKLMGSYRLRVALGILCKNSFQCPYCSESSALELRLPKTRFNLPRR